MLEIFSTLLTGVLSGGATGLIGILLQRYFDLQNKKQDIEITRLNHANNLELCRLEGERAKQHDQTSLTIAQLAAESEEVQADYRGLEAALQADKATYFSGPSANWFTVVLFTLVDFLRGVIRPGMTAYLCGLVSVMFFWVRDLAESREVVLTSVQVHELMLQIITTILYVFVTVSLFWFGTRPQKQR